MFFLHGAECNCLILGGAEEIQIDGGGHSHPISPRVRTDCTFCIFLHSFCVDGPTCPLQLLVPGLATFFGCSISLRQQSTGHMRMDDKGREPKHTAFVCVCLVPAASSLFFGLALSHAQLPPFRPPSLKLRCVALSNLKAGHQASAEDFKGDAATAGVWAPARCRAGRPWQPQHETCSWQAPRLKKLRPVALQASRAQCPL